MADFAVALTGGIATGKSSAERRFRALGVEVADADALARILVAPGEPALDDIVAQFGPGVLHRDGSLNRPQLRERVFVDVQARLALEAILHPRIRTALRAACAAASGAYAIASIPLLAEGGGRAGYPWIDRIVVVESAPERQLQRLLQRDGGTAALARRMLAAQASAAQRRAIADELIDNNGSLEALEAQVDALHAALVHLALQRQASKGDLAG